MNMDIFTIVGVVGIICVASAIQSAVGFAFALFATPLLTWTGMPLQYIITTVSVCSFVQSSLGTRHLRASVPWRLSLLVIASRLVTLVLGILILKKIAGLDVSGIRLIVGSVLCLLVILQLVGKIRPSEKVHWVWGGLAFSTSGLLMGITGMGGPPLVLWAVAHNWSVEKTRGFLFSVFAATIPIQIMLLYITFGTDILLTAMRALLLAPAVYLGVKIGIPIGNRMPRQLLRRIVYLLLLAIGLSSILPTIIQQLR